MAFSKGRYAVSVAKSAQDIVDAQDLRGLCFNLAGRDSDAFDPNCAHILIRSLLDNRLVGCFRMLPVTGGSVQSSYSAQFYDLEALSSFKGPMIELGRFCIHPHAQDPDIIRLAWAALTAYVDECQISMLFGCTSFAGTDTSVHQEVFELLGKRHATPRYLVGPRRSRRATSLISNAMAAPSLTPNKPWRGCHHCCEPTF